MAFITLSQLTKAVKGLVNKINLESNVTNSKIGTLSDLSTTTKDNLVAAVNEVAAETLPSVTSSDNGKIATVVNGAWSKATKPTYTATEVGALPSNTVIPAAQVNSDWNASSGVAQILNKPSNVSSFTNDTGYITSSDIPTNVGSFTNDIGYIASTEEATFVYLTLNNGIVTVNKNFMEIYAIFDNVKKTFFTLPLSQYHVIVMEVSEVDAANQKISLVSIIGNTKYSTTLEPSGDSAMAGTLTTTTIASTSDIPSVDATLSTSGASADAAATGTALAAKPSVGTYTTGNGSVVRLTSVSNGSTDTYDLYPTSELYRKSEVDSSLSGKLGTTDNAYRTASIPMGHLDSTSTATVMTATVPGITELRDGVCVWLKNGVVTSAAGFTININNLGAKPCYGSLAAATQSSTVFNINYTMLFIYNSTRVSGGCWDIVYGYDSNTNTIGYQLRTNSMSRPMDSITYRYRLLFTSADGTKWVPATNSTSTNATASRTVCQSKIDPFGSIRYYGTTASVAAGSRPSTAYLWQQYNITLGYSFNRTGAALTLTSWKPVYVKCAPQTDGSAIIDSTTPYVQDLPSTADGKIYIYLGVATAATTVELEMEHPVYCYREGSIQRWTGVQAEIDAIKAQIAALDVLDEEEF